MAITAAQLLKELPISCLFPHHIEPASMKELDPLVMLHPGV